MKTRFEKEQFLKTNKQIIEAYTSKFYSLYKNKCSMDYNDFKQEGYLIALQLIDKYDEDFKTSFSTYLYICLRNHFLGLASKRMNSITYLINDIISEDDNYEDIFGNEDDDKIKFTSFKELSKTENKFLRLLTEGYTFEQIESIMGITRNNRLQIVYNIRKKLI